MTTTHATIAIIWLILVVIAGTTHYLRPSRWTWIALATLAGPLVGVVWALTLPRRRRVPEQLEHDDETSLPPRTLPDPIATEDDYEAATHPPAPPAPGPDADDRILADWLDAAASRPD